MWQGMQRTSHFSISSTNTRHECLTPVPGLNRFTVPGRWSKWSSLSLVPQSTHPHVVFTSERKRVRLAADFLSEAFTRSGFASFHRLARSDATLMPRPPAAQEAQTPSPTAKPDTSV